MQTFPIVKPTLYDVLQQHKEDILSTLRVAVPGEVTSFNGTRRTATIKVLLKRVLSDGSLVDYKPLLDCPVLTMQGGGAFVQFPVAVGDQGLVIFADRNIGSWFQNGDDSPMPDLRAHNLSDGIFIPGLNSLQSSLPAYPSDKMVIAYQGSTIEIDATGINLIGDGGATVELQAAIATIRNGSTTLLTVLNGLIDVLKTLQVTGPISLTPASIASLEAYKLVLATLLG